jgi:hypothetical protein
MPTLWITTAIHLGSISDEAAVMREIAAELDDANFWHEGAP